MVGLKEGDYFLLLLVVIIYVSFSCFSNRVRFYFVGWCMFVYLKFLLIVEC